MDKKIKSIVFVLENCESIHVPYKCFEDFKFTADKTKADEKHTGYITNLECTIKNNGSMEGGFDEHTSPIQRLYQCNDICWVDIYYDDNTEENYYVNWYDSPQENKNQTSELIDYKTIHIKVEPYIQKYLITEIINFEIGTIFLGKSDSKIYEIKENKENNNKFISNTSKLTEIQVKQLYTKIN